MRTLAIAAFLSVLFSLPGAATTPDAAAPAKGYFNIGADGSYGGLSPKGLTFLKEQRDRLRAINESLNGRLLNLRSAIHAVLVGRMLKGHMFIYGPPGGAKSLLARELLAFEARQQFQIQLHQAMTDQPLVGGQDFEAAKRGEYVVNTAGSLVTFETAILDEIDKASPSVLSVLLGLLNEREVQVGRRVIKAELQSGFATSNALLHEVFESFRENGQLSTAAALLNRFPLKTCLYNWLPDADQEKLSELKFKRMLEDASHFERNTKPEAKPREMLAVDWTALQQFANYVVRFSPNAMKAYTRLVNQMRAVTNHEVEASRTRFNEDPESEPFVYFPTADYTERLRQVIPEAIIYSVFIDFLLSPLSDDAVLNAGFLNQAIELQPSSLWRGYLIQTTIFSGEATLQNNEGKFFVEFSNRVDRRKLRDNRERALFKMIEKEQARFKVQYAKVANFKCTDAPSTKWLDPKGQVRKDIEELLQPNKESDRIRREKFNTFVPCDDKAKK